MEFKYNYQSSALKPIYAGSGAVASLSGDGIILATPILDEINVIQLTEPRKVLRHISNDDEQEITALRLTPDGKFLCFTSQAQLLRIIEVSTGSIMVSLKLSSSSFMIDCDGTSTLAAIGGTDGSITIVDIEKGHVTHSLKGHGGTISCLSFYGEFDGNAWLLASGDTNGTVKVWDLVKRKCLHTVQEHSSAVRGVQIRCNSEEEYELISGGRDDIVNLLQFNSKKRCKLIKTIPTHQQVETCGYVQWGNEGQYSDYIYTAGGNGMFQIISLSSGAIVKKTSVPIEELYVIGVIPVCEGTEFYLIMSDQTIINIDMVATMEDMEIPIIEYNRSTLAGNHGTIADMCIVGPKLDKLALATNSPSMRMIAMPTSTSSETGLNEELQTRTALNLETDIYEAHTDILNSVSGTEDGKWVASTSKDKTCILWRWDEETDKFVQYAQFVGHSSSVTAVGLPHVNPKGYPEFVITSSNDLTIKKWRVPKPDSITTDVGKHVVKVSEYTRHAHEKDINGLSISPNDSIFATASYDKSCKIWDFDTGELKATLNGHKRGLWDVSFCQYDKLLATSSGDRTVKVWNLDSNTVVKTLEGHTNAVQRCSFLNQMNQVVSAGADGLIKIWDVQTGECLKTLDGHDNRTWALLVINDGTEMVSADADGVIRFWRDCTEETVKEQLEQDKIRVEQEQSLQNYLASEDWANAFLLAMKLDHPMRLFNVLRQSMRSSASLGGQARGGAGSASPIFNSVLDEAIGQLDDADVVKLLKRCRDWNTNAKTHRVAQCAITCVLKSHKIDKLTEIPGLVAIVDGIVPYTQRHFARVDNLLEESYILDHALFEMDKLALDTTVTM